MGLFRKRREKEGIAVEEVQTYISEDKPSEYTDKSGEKTPTFKQIADHFEKKSKKEKSDSAK